MDDNRTLKIDIIETAQQPKGTLAVRESTQVICGPGSTAGLNGKQVLLYDSPTTTVGYFFDVNNSSVAPPIGPTRTVRVSVLSTDAGILVASKWQAVLNQDSMFSNVVLGSSVTITNSVPEAVPNATTDTTWAITTIVAGITAVRPTNPLFTPADGRIGTYAQMGGLAVVDNLSRRMAISLFGSELLVGPNQAYPDIPTAIAAANPGDRIKVLNGTYNGNIVVTKPRITIVGEGIGTIVNGDIVLETGADYTYITNLYLRKNISFLGVVKYCMFVYNWISNTTIIKDETIQTSTSYTYSAYAINTLMFNYYASAVSVYNTFAFATTTLPTRAYAEVVGSTFATGTITDDTIAHAETTYRTYAAQSATYNSSARRTRASDAFAYADTTYMSRATSTITAGVYATGATTYTTKATSTQNASTYAIGDTTFRTHAIADYAGVRFTAQEWGVNGNLISLFFNGFSDIDTIVGDWNIINPTNQVSFTGRPGTDILAIGMVDLVGGSTGNPVRFKADFVGTIGNSISLVFDGILTIEQVVVAWNAVNLLNTVSHDGNDVGVPPAGTLNLSLGSDTGTVSFIADKTGVVGNSISLVFTGANTVLEAVNTWNTSFPANAVLFTGRGDSIIVASTVTLSGGTGANPVSFKAVNVGVVGNSITLTWTGTNTVQEAITTWNNANLGNTVSLVTGDPAGIVSPAGSTTLSGGTNGATVVFNAVNLGVGGNTISLVFNGTSSVDTVVAAWNAGNMGNQVSFTGVGTSIPLAQTSNLGGGVGTTTVRFQSEAAGVNGNTTTLVFNGTDTIQEIVVNWNAANPGRRVTTTGALNGVVAASSLTLAGGRTASPYTFVATNIGPSGNSISLIFDGVDSLGQVVADWNAANTGNLVTHTGIATDILIAQTINLTGGAFDATVIFTADTLGIGGNSISLVFDGIQTIQTVVNDWNNANTPNTVTFNQGGSGVVGATTIALVGGVGATTMAFLAITPGVVGNVISLTFNGISDTVQNVVAAWNAANNTNQVVGDSDTGPPPSGAIPPAGIYTLAFGADDVTMTFSALTLGQVGNLITLNFIPGETVTAVINNWNGPNPLNQATHNTNGSFMLGARTLTLSGGSDSGAFQFVAVNPGIGGNSISIVASGTQTTVEIIDAWNLANPTDPITTSANSPNTVPIVGTYPLSRGRDAQPVSFTAVTSGTPGNTISLVFDGVSGIIEVVDAWNNDPTNAANQVTYPAVEGVYYLAPQTITLAGGQTNIPITFTADVAGPDGNTIILVFNGTDLVGTVTDAWNASNPTNPVSTTGLPSGLVLARTITLSGGNDANVYVFKATTLGVIGNSIILSWDGTNSIDQVVDAWNIANPTNTCSYTGGVGTFIPPTPVSITLAQGSDSTVVTFTSVYPGSGFELNFDGVDNIGYVVADWNLYNPTQAVTHDGRPDGICPAGTVRLIVNGDNNVWILISEL